MGFLFGEIFMGWKRDKKVFLMLLGLSAAGIFSMGIAFYLFHDTEHQVREYKEVYENVQFYSIADNFAGVGPEELEAEKNTDQKPRLPGQTADMLWGTLLSLTALYIR